MIGQLSSSKPTNLEAEVNSYDTERGIATKSNRVAGRKTDHRRLESFHIHLDKPIPGQTVRVTNNTSNQPLHHPQNHKHHKHTILTMLGAIAGLQPRQLAAQILNFALVLSTAFMLWKGLSVATDSSSPIVVVLSGSMEPAFQRGDLLFLWNRGVETQVGEVVVYNVRGKDIPIVHRVIRKFGGG